MDDEKIINATLKARNISNLVSSIIIVIIMVTLFFKVEGNTSKIIMLPFILCALFIFGNALANIFNINKAKKLFSKAYVITFLCFWFGAVGFATYYAFQEASYDLVFFTIPFWIVGFYMLYKNLIK